jgi:hypothetical protein
MFVEVGRIDTFAAETLLDPLPEAQLRLQAMYPWPQHCSNCRIKNVYDTNLNNAQVRDFAIIRRGFRRNEHELHGAPWPQALYL